jgi:hypothetical protein
MTIVDQIRANDLTDLNLCKVPKEYCRGLKQLVEALRVNKSLESVRFDKDFLACVYGRERGELLEQVAKLPKLKAVTLGDTGLLVQVITKLVKDSKGLTAMTLERVVMQGVQEDFDTLETALHQHTSLKVFHMNECVASNEGIDMEKIMKAGKSVNTTNISDPAQVKKGAIAA